MADARIYVTWPMEPEARAGLDAIGTVESSHTEDTLPGAEVCARVAGVEAILPVGAPPVSEAVMANIARGPVVDGAALARALREGQIAGVGLDVFEDEPAVHPGLLDPDQVVPAPHTGSASRATRIRVATRWVDNGVAALRGERPPDLVNPTAWQEG